MKKMRITLLNQYKLTALLVGICVLPYLLVKIYLPEVPYVAIYFLLALLFIKLLSFNDNEYKNKVRGLIAKQYQKSFKQSLNKKDLELYTAFQMTSRNAVLVLIGFVIIVFEILLKA